MFTLVLVSKSWNGKRKLVTKGESKTYREVEQIKDRLEYYNNRTFGIIPDYRILGPKQLKALQAEIKAEQDARRKGGAKKAAETRKKRGPNNFILCPKCKAKSKLLFSEFGGLQTRRCQNGHQFEHDKWLADRLFWKFIL